MTEREPRNSYKEPVHEKKSSRAERKAKRQQEYEAQHRPRRNSINNR